MIFKVRQSGTPYYKPLHNEVLSIKAKNIEDLKDTLVNYYDLSFRYDILTTETTNKRITP